MSSKSLNQLAPSTACDEAFIAFLQDQTGVVHCGDTGPIFGCLHELCGSPHQNVVTRYYWAEAVSIALTGEQGTAQPARRSQWTRAVATVLPEGVRRNDTSSAPLPVRKLLRRPRGYVR